MCFKNISMRRFWKDESNGTILFKSPLNLPINPDKALRIAKPKIPNQHLQQNQETKTSNVNRWKPWPTMRSAWYICVRSIGRHKSFSQLENRTEKPQSTERVITGQHGGQAEDSSRDWEGVNTIPLTH